MLELVVRKCAVGCDTLTRHAENGNYRRWGRARQMQVP